MAPTTGLLLTAGDQLLLGKLPDRLEHPDARVAVDVAFDPDEAALHQRGQPVHDRHRRAVRPGGGRFHPWQWRGPSHPSRVLDKERIENGGDLLSLAGWQRGNERCLASIHQVVGTSEDLPPRRRQFDRVRPPVLAAGCPPDQAALLEIIDERDHGRPVDTEGRRDRLLGRHGVRSEGGEDRVMPCVNTEWRQRGIRFLARSDSDPVGKIGYASREIRR